MSHNHDDQREGQLSRDRDTIREWAREHDATPIRETETGEESEQFRMVPEDQMAETHEEVEWEEFFNQLDEGDHVVIYHADGDSEPFEIVGQRGIASRVDDEEIEQRLMEGETVTSTFTETTVVESVVVEETTVDTELVDSRVVDERVVDAELLRRACTDCELIADETADTREWFNSDRYLDTVTGHVAGAPVDSMETDGREGTADASSMNAADRSETTASGGTETRGTGGDREPTGVMDSDSGRTRMDKSGSGSTRMSESGSGSTRMSESGSGSESETGNRESPFHGEFEVEETWAVTRSFTEEFIVESRVTDTEVTEADAVEDYDIEIEGLHQSIVQSGIIEDDVPADEAMSEYEIQSELAEPDRITTTFMRERTVEDEIVDTSLATASVTDTQPLGMEVVRTKQLENVAATEPDPEEETELSADEEASAHATAGDEAGSRVTITDDAVGHSVVNAEGEQIGMVTEVEEEANALFVDPEPGIAARIRSVLGWGSADDDDYRLEAEAVRRITDDQVELKSPEELN